MSGLALDFGPSMIEGRMSNIRPCIKQVYVKLGPIYKYAWHITS